MGIDAAPAWILSMVMHIDAAPTWILSMVMHIDTALTLILSMVKGAQWLSGRVLPAFHFFQTPCLNGMLCFLNSLRHIVKTKVSFDA